MAQLMQHGEDALSTAGSLDKAAGTKLTYKSIEPGNSFSRVPAMDEGLRRGPTRRSAQNRGPQTRELVAWL